MDESDGDGVDGWSGHAACYVGEDGVAGVDINSHRGDGVAEGESIGACIDSDLGEIDDGVRGAHGDGGELDEELGAWGRGSCVGDEVLERGGVGSELKTGMHIGTRDIELDDLHRVHGVHRGSDLDIIVD